MNTQKTLLLGIPKTRKCSLIESLHFDRKAIHLFDGDWRAKNIEFKILSIHVYDSNIFLLYGSKTWFLKYMERKRWLGRNGGRGIKIKKCWMINFFNFS